MVSVHNIGLTQLSASGSPASDAYQVNIIFVHGLRGHPQKTWEAKRSASSRNESPTPSKPRGLRSLFRPKQSSSTADVKGDHESDSDTTFWPADFLDPDLPNARVWTYGYNADLIGIFKANNKNSVSQHGNDLSVQLERDLHNEDPIIFIVHSLGGIVTKDALRRSPKLRQKTQLVVFLGTPHRGSDAAAWGVIASNLARLTFQDSNKRLIETLKVNGEVFDNIHEEFLNVVLGSGMRLHSFQESRGISGVKGLSGKVVDDYSSKLGLARQFETVESIDANHMEMAKCLTRDDPQYRAILGVVRQFTRMGSGAIEVGLETTVSTDKKEEVGAGGLASDHANRVTEITKNGIIRPLRAENSTQYTRTDASEFLDPRNYEVIWIAPLEIEARAALCLLDERHRSKFAVTRGDEYVFHAGSMCGHNIVIATLPAGQEYGTGSAAALASQVKRFFPNLWFGLLVGVAAGLPDLTRQPPRDIRLGDVLVGLPEGDSAGLIAYDLGKEIRSGFVPLRGGHVLAMTEPIVRSAIGSIKLEAPNDAQKFLHYYEAIQHKEHPDGTFVDPGQYLDDLYLTRHDGTAERVDRDRRPEERRTRVWYGPIGSGEKLLKNAQTRDELRDRYGLIGLEMEAAGTMSRIPVGVIRGVCDYGDEHKNKEWQPYAAAMAAAYGKAVLAEISPVHRPTAPGMTENKLIPSERDSPFYYMQLSENARFTGRAAILQTLEEKLFGRRPCRRVALVGLGGVGKTQVALRFAYQVKKKQADCSIFWVPILSISSLEQAYTEIAKRIGLQKSDEEEDVKALVCRYLSSDRAGKWLIVVDNADDRDLLFGDNDNTGIEEFFPQSEHGSVLLTTRSRHVAVDFAQMEVVDVEQMSHKEALPFLQNSLKKSPTPQDDKTVTELLTHLTYLPLAIAQAAAYLNQTKMPIHKYLGLLRGAEKDVARVLSRDFKDPTRYKGSQNAIATTWLVSFEQIQNTDRAAINILLFLSCIEPKAIPQSILPECGSEEELEWAIGLLCGYSFLVRRGESDVFDMHHLVQSATRGWIEKSGRQDKVLSDGISHLAEVFPSSDRVNRDIWRGYLPHAVRVLEGGKEHQTEQRANLCMDVGQCLAEDRRFKEAIGYLQAVYHYRKSFLPEKDDSRLTSEHELARVYLSDRQIQKAIEMLEHVVSVRKTTLAEKDHSRLASEHQLASAYFSDRRIQKAIEILEHVVSVQKTTLAEKDNSRLASEHELASVYLSDRRIQKAIEMLEHVVSVEKRTLAEEDHSRLVSEHQLASAYLFDRRIQKAIEMLEHVVSIRKTTLAEEDHSRLVSEYQLASAYLSDRRIQKAIEILEHVVSVQKTTLAEEDYSRLASEHQLASAYLSDRRIQKAIEMLEHVVSVQKTTLAEEDHSRLTSEHELARVYLSDRQIQKAIEMLEHVVSIRKTTLAEKDHFRLASEHQLASAYLDDDQAQKAIAILENVVAIEESLIHKDDPARLASKDLLFVARNQLEAGCESTDVDISDGSEL